VPPDIGGISGNKGALTTATTCGNVVPGTMEAQGFFHGVKRDSETLHTTPID
jgi:hypothetical protein